MTRRAFPDQVTAPRPDPGDRPRDADATRAPPLGRDHEETKGSGSAPLAPLRRTIDPAYTLHGEIARGGMGAVLKGRDADLGRDLAVKVLLERPPRQPRAGPPVRRGGPDRRPAPAPRHRPGLRAGHLRRPPAVLHHEAGQGPHPGRPRWPSGRRPADDLPRFLAIFEQVCQTVAYAHARGRDPPRPEAVERDGRHASARSR